MFRRKSTETDQEKTNVPAADDFGIPAKPGMRGAAPPPPPGRSPVLPPRAAPAAEPRAFEVPRAADIAPRPVPPPARVAETEMRKLIVGREIALSGEINSCDRLVVEGSVEANLVGCREIDIAESGLFKGSASIDDAEIRGRFEGNLTVRKRLMIRATGKVEGTVRYGQIEIECGGQVSGDVQVQPIATEPSATRPAQAAGASHSLLDTPAS